MDWGEAPNLPADSDAVADYIGAVFPANSFAGFHANLWRIGGGFPPVPALFLYNFFCFSFPFRCFPDVFHVIPSLAESKKEKKKKKKKKKK